MDFSPLAANSRVLTAGGRALGVSPAYATYGIDPDATAWLTAAGISNSATEYDTGIYRRTGAQLWTAGDAYVKGLKLNSLWPRLAGLWPLAGASADAHAVNAVNATPATFVQDPNGPAATFSGGFSPNQGGWFDTGFRPADLPQDSVALSAYLRNSRDAVEIPLGAADAGVVNGLYLFPSFAGQNFSRLNQNDSAPLAGATTIGLQLVARTSDMRRASFNRGLKNGEDTVLSTGTSTSSLYAGAANVAGQAMYRAGYTLGSFHIWRAAPTDEQAAIFNQLEEAWQTALGRNV